MAGERFRTRLSEARIRRHELAGEWPCPGLAELAEQRRASSPDVEILVDGDIRLTFRDLAERAQALAGGLRDLGIGAGDVVSWELPSWWESAVIAIALDWIGAISNPIIPIYRDREVGFVVRQAGSRALIVPGSFRGFDYREMARSVQAVGPTLQHLVVVRDRAGDGFVGFDDLLRSETRPERRLRSPYDVSMVFYTSGTTADPKGVMHTTATIGAYTQSGVAVLGKEPDDVGLLQFPLTHIGGLAAFVAGPLLFGSRVVYLDQWEPNRALDLIEQEKVTSAGGPPVILQGLVAAATLTPERVRTLRTAGTGAAGVPPQLVRDVTEKLGAFSFRSYGLTECPMLTTGVPDDPEVKRMLTDGRPSPGCEVRIVDADGQPLPRGREGEIQAFGPQLCVGYLDPELTREAFTDDGFLQTGDLGVMDEEGYVTVTGRVKDIIIRKGENLSAKAIEDILLDHPEIVDAAVIGLPDADSGERACAVVVVRAGAPAPDLDAVRRFMADRQIMRQMIPEQVEVVDSLPRNATGKVLKFELQKRFSA